jgi:Methyltransferase domain
VKPLIYSDLVGWYRLLDPPSDHLDEATSYREALERAASPRPETLLELGAGAGHNASFLKQRFRCTLTDVAEPMLALSRELNPECEHVAGDMRALRLGRVFDCVFVHDAIMYMTTVDDLAAVAETAFVHTRPGGAALFAPDYVRETFAEGTEVLQADDGPRSLRCLEWHWDPDPADETYRVEYAFLLRDGTEVSAAHDRHVEGLFARDTWLSVLSKVGFEVSLVHRPLDHGETDEVFLCRRA